MKMLCVCHAGFVRSAATAMILKNRRHDAIAIGVNHAKPETIKMMSEWADKILLAESHMIAWIPAEFQDKVEESFEIGPDEWGTPTDMNLWEKIYKVLPVYPNDDTSLDLV